MVKKMSETRRAAILAAAKVVFEEVGFALATMDEIAARVGGSKATLYRYFESKDALFQELLRRTATEQNSPMLALLPGRFQDVDTEMVPVNTLLRPGADVSATLQEVGEQVLRRIHTPERIQGRRMVIAAATNSEVGRLFYENGPGKGIEIMAQYLNSVMQKGQLRSANPKVAAVHYRALIEAEVDEAGLLNVLQPMSDGDIRDYVARAVDVFMRAYGPETR